MAACKLSYLVAASSPSRKECFKNRPAPGSCSQTDDPNDDECDSWA